MTLRIGILGAARIAQDGIVDPARALGHQIVAIAARDRSRAEAFAAEHGVRRVHDSYADLVADPEIDLVYDALVNSAHAEWNTAALRAGKHILSEKPFASNAAEARALRETAAGAPGTLVEGFHYLHHPVHQRLRELVISGDLGELERVEVTLAIPAPPAADPRWSLALSGGATMDLGCYVLHAARQVGRWIGADPELRGVQCTRREPEIDSAMAVELGYPGGVVGWLRWDMDADQRVMTWTLVGSTATATSVAFGVPHLDNRLLVTQDGQITEERLGDATSYTYQLAALAATLEAGAPFPLDLDDAVANAVLIDECYRRAGLTPRGSPGGR